MVRLPAALGGEHGVVDLKDALFGAIAAVGLFVLLPDAGELVEDVGHGIARLREVMHERCQLLRCLALGPAPGTIRFAWQIEVEEGSVQLTADLEASFVVPRKRWSIIAAVTSQGCYIVRRVGEFENAGEKPVLEGGPTKGKRRMARPSRAGQAAKLETA